MRNDRKPIMGTVLTASAETAIAILEAILKTLFPQKPVQLLW